MVSHIATLAFRGLQVIDVDVQVHMAPGIPALTLVGLPDKIVAESRERVRAALSSLDIAIPPRRITINLAPADLAKEGSHFDLPIACALLQAMEILPSEFMQDYIVMGELSLDGNINHIPGILPAAIGAVERNKGIICPAGNAREASWAGDLPIIAVRGLYNLIECAKGKIAPPPIANDVALEGGKYLDLKDVKGQKLAKRALEIAAAGQHNMLMCGPPGVGKSMLAQRILGILPPLTTKETLETSMVASIAGELPDGKVISARPFRSPHHSCSMAAMVGGGVGRRALPGEVSMAHNGVLFLDELPEFPRVVLDSLRQPMETGSILIARANSHISYPARFQLIGAMNPCPCGYLGDSSRACNRAPKCAVNYQMKISGPILDRFDLHVELSQLSLSEINAASEAEEDSKTIAARVKKAREIQQMRYQNDNFTVNAHLDGEKLKTLCRLDEKSEKMLYQAAEKYQLSMRGYNRILRLARTIADLEEQEMISSTHLAEAISFRIIKT